MALKFGAANLVTENVWVQWRVGGPITGAGKKKGGHLVARAFLQDSIGAWAFASMLRQSKAKEVKFIFEIIQAE